MSEIQQLLYTGKHEETLTIVDEIEKSSSSSNNFRIAAQLLKAESFLIRGRYKDCVALLTNLLEECISIDNLGLKLDTIILLCEASWREGDYEKSLEIIVEGEQDFIKLTSLKPEEMKFRYAEIKKLKGINYRFNGELDLAYEYFSESLSEFKNVNAHAKVGELLNYIGLVHHDKGELNEAWNYYIKSLEIRDLTEYIGSIAESFFNLGRIQIERGELDSALEYQMQSLEMSTEYGDERIIAKNYDIIGLIYHNKGQIEAAFEYYSKSLAIKRELGNDLETSWTLYRTLDLVISSKIAKVFQVFYDELETLNRRNPESKFISLHYSLIRARKLKESSRTVQRAEAQQLFQEIMNEEIVDFELTINAMLNLCEELLGELKQTGNEEILDELIDLFVKLAAVAQEQNSFSLIIEIYILQSKLALLELDITKAQNYLSQALTLAEDRGLRQLAVKISNQYDNLLDQISNWTDLHQKETSLTERVQRAELEQYVAGMIRKRSDEVKFERDDPILLMILGKDGRNIYSRKFMSDTEVNDQLIALFLVGINNIINEALPVSGTVERLKHAEYMLIMNEKENISIFYLFKGSLSYSAREKLNLFITYLMNDVTEWNYLQSGVAVDASRLDSKVDEIFIQDE
ncbi:MAG: tetratricopeptide repeat protein [Candidatus Kariarchaeaceae archaeon]